MNSHTISAFRCVHEPLHSHCPLTQLAREICLHIRIVHPHVVALYVAWKDSKYVYLALEWAPQVRGRKRAWGRGRWLVWPWRLRQGTCDACLVLDIDTLSTARVWKSENQRVGTVP